MLINILVLLCYNVIMIFIYKSKHPFFEKYRVNPVSFAFIAETVALVIGLRGVDSITKKDIESSGVQ